MFTKFLDTSRIEVWKRLVEFKDVGILAGGTALSMQINHRISYDFDVFTDKPIDDRFLLKLKKIFWEYEVEPMVDTGDELTVMLSGNVKLSFVYFPFVKLEKAVETDSLDLFSINDLLANKAYALGRRKTWRDYVDIYWALKNNLIDLKKLITITEQKFDGVFSAKLFLEQLVYFSDVAEIEVDWTGEKVENEDIKKYLFDEVTNYLK
ncbi:hypothetical protein CO009_03385 [Candidatus Shapirobacteria bacterium CG_4_8_14_3_um_filter_35_11]|uniref:Nucleotidyl transferase AbiEii/AbiGii toxin family protein n=3 Tax=Candidatus Shapironibacteriota TaxID=1752721 RepID=A0A2M7XP42_9BACT|nr:MAG: hypothetical protein CO168_00310 [Candidatus Shapirobacteria bacterium CG_4_9_14_3_um_filter_36_12]PJC79781.1 MAG: hypothetical protein CO009_03385 [Candidatus Shapirobacteria bacterium CG_4_8_14_3_um_filter_35_11]